MVKFLIGDTLTGRRIQTLPDVKSGDWSDELNKAGSISCVVPLTDPAIRRRLLRESATPVKSFLAAVEDDVVLQAGPIWDHDWSDDTGELTLTASGIWSLLEHRTLLPVLGSLSPTDSATDTNVTSSLQGIAVAWLEQSLLETGGDLPLVIPAAIAGTNIRQEAGANLAILGSRLTDLTKVENGPDIRFVPRYTTDLLGIEWVVVIGTPTAPQIIGAIEPTFNVGMAASSVSKFKVNVNGANLASRAFAAGGRSADTTVIGVAYDSTLVDAGYPLTEAKDSSHGSATEQDTLDAVANELVLRGRRPIMTMTFDHDTTKTPALAGFNVGDIAQVKVRNNRYLEDGTYRARIVARRGNQSSKNVSLTFQEEVLP